MGGAIVLALFYHNKHKPFLSFYIRGDSFSPKKKKKEESLFPAIKEQIFWLLQVSPFLHQMDIGRPITFIYEVCKGAEEELH